MFMAVNRIHKTYITKTPAERKNLTFRFCYGPMIARIRDQLALKVSEFVYRVKIRCRFKAIPNVADNLLSEQCMAMNLKM